MGKERAFPLIQCSDPLHIKVIQDKIKHIEILGHPLYMDGLRYYNNVLLYQIAQRCLRRRLPIFCADLIQGLYSAIS